MDKSLEMQKKKLIELTNKHKSLKAAGMQEEALAVFMEMYDLDERICAMVWTPEETMKRMSEFDDIASKMPKNIKGKGTVKETDWILSNVSWNCASTIRHIYKINELHEAIERFNELKNKTAPTPAPVAPAFELSAPVAPDESSAAPVPAKKAPAQNPAERAEVMRASYAAAESFELGGDPLDNLTGQGAFFF